jgi:hypothetical protein
MAILVYRKMYGSERPSPNLLFDNVLVDSVLGYAVISTCYVLGMSIERFLLAISRPTQGHRIESSLESAFSPLRAGERKRFAGGV